MSLAKIEKPAWQGYLDQVSKTLIGKSAEIEVDSLAIGHQVAAEWLPLLGIVYDRKSDMIEIILEGLDHMIHKPSELYVDTDSTGLTSLEVIDVDDVRQIIKLRDPIMLPPPQSQGSATRH